MDKRIINYILINGRKTHSLGLFHGKAGVAMSMFFYARKTDNKLYYDYARDLMLDVSRNVCGKGVSVDLEHGLAGIGVALTVYACLFPNEAHDIIEKIAFIDENVQDRVLHCLEDDTLQDEMKGLKHYMKIRGQSALKHFRGKEKLNVSNQFSLTINLKGVSLLSLFKCPLWPVEEYRSHAIDLDGGCSYYVLKECLYGI